MHAAQPPPRRDVGEVTRIQIIVGCQAVFGAFAAPWTSVSRPYLYLAKGKRGTTYRASCLTPQDSIEESGPPEALGLTEVLLV
jgi:hypothetical protein